jgi:FimV-like protein
VPPTDQSAQADSQPGSASTEQDGSPTRLRIANLRDLQTRIQTAQSDNPEISVAKAEPSSAPAETSPTAAATSDTSDANAPTATESNLPPAVAQQNAAAVAATNAETAAVSETQPAEIRLDTAALSAAGSDSENSTPSNTEELVAAVPVQSLQAEQIGAQEPTQTAAETPDTATADDADTEQVVETALEAATTEQASTETEASSQEVATVEMPQQPSAAGIDVMGLLIKFQRDPMGAWREIQQHPLGLPVAGGVLVVLLLLIMSIVRRSKKAEDYTDIDRDLALTAAAAGKSRRALRQDSPADRQLEQSSGARLRRVDFLIAGGSYEEAEKILRRALAENPFDLEVKEKMLDAYYKSSNADQFITVAESMRNQIEDEQSPQWQRVVKLGNKIYPGHPLFASQPDEKDETIIFAPSENAESASAVNQAEETPQVTPEPTQEERGQVLNFGEAGLENRTSDTTEDTIIPQSDVPSFDMGDLNEWRSDQSDADANAGQINASDNDALRFTGVDDNLLDDGLNITDSQAPDADLDFNLDPTPSTSSQDSSKRFDLDFDETASSSSNFGDDTLSFNEDALRFDTGTDQSKQDNVVDLQKARDADNAFDLSLSDDTVDEEDTQLISAALSGDSTQAMNVGDHVEVKLDLAGAYLEMDDRAGAVSLLEEVASEGSATQQAKARELLGRLA